MRGWMRMSPPPARVGEMSQVSWIDAGMKVYAPTNASSWQPNISRWATFRCALVGHDFNGYGQRVDSQTRELKEREVDCARCKMTYCEVFLTKDQPTPPEARP